MRRASRWTLLLAVMFCGQWVTSRAQSSARRTHEKRQLGFSPGDIRQAFEKAQARVTDRRTRENRLNQTPGGTVPTNVASAEVRHQGRGGNNRVIEMNHNQEVFEEATRELQIRGNLSPDQVLYDLPRTPLPDTIKAVQDCKRLFNVEECDRNTPYRTADGRCNNLAIPIWGMAASCAERLLPPLYEDGLEKPVLFKQGRPLPNARTVSTFIHTDLDRPSPLATPMVMQWGQFMDHDLTLTPMKRIASNKGIFQCCPVSNHNYPPCMAIDIPPDDRNYRSDDKNCLNFVRSTGCNSQCTLGPRGQTNVLTAFVDASNVYGSDEQETTTLRSFARGLLRSTTTGTDELLPQVPIAEENQCTSGLQQSKCFLAGDERVNEQPGLTVMHTIFMRQHNKIANFLNAKPNLRDKDEEIFQKTRRLVIAQVQHITYTEFLPIVLGPDVMRSYNMLLGDSRRTTYNPQAPPGILHEFATAAYRFGHTLIQNLMPEVNDRRQTQRQLNLSDSYFNVFAVNSGRLPEIARGLYSISAQFFDRHVVKAVTHDLYKRTGAAFGLDLPAFNIQRARDHGLRSYTDYIGSCHHRTVNSFPDLGGFMPRESWVKLSQIYKSVHDIELFAGGVSEFPLANAVVGPTFACIIGEQFHRLMYGDRFFYTHRFGDQTKPFTDAELAEIRKTTLAQILCSNAKIPRIPANVFALNQPEVICSNLPSTNVNLFA